MSRIEDYDIYDTASFLRSCAFGHNVEQALKGKKGQKFLRELEAELVAMPEKRLRRGRLAEKPIRIDKDVKIEGEVCALGAVAVARAVRAGLSRDKAFAQVSRIAPADDYKTSEWQKIKKAAAALGISTPLAYAIIYQNDEGSSETPEEVYNSVLSWVRSKIKVA